MHVIDRRAFRLLAALVVLVLPLAVAACGGSDDDGGSGGSAARQTPTADEREIRDKVAKVGKAMEARDTEVVCAEMTTRIQEQMKRLEGHPTCAKGLFDAITDDPTGKAVALEPGAPRVTAVDVNGRRAIVTGTKDGSPRRATLEKEGGSWKFATWFTPQ